MDKNEAKQDITTAFDKSRSIKFNSNASKTRFVNKILDIVDKVDDNTNIRKAKIHNPAPKNFSKSTNNVMTSAKSAKGDEQSEAWREKKKSGRKDQ